MTPWRKRRRTDPEPSDSGPPKIELGPRENTEEEVLQIMAQPFETATPEQARPDWIAEPEEPRPDTFLGMTQHELDRRALLEERMQGQASVTSDLGGLAVLPELLRLLFGGTVLLAVVGTPVYLLYHYGAVWVAQLLSQ